MKEEEIVRRYFESMRPMTEEEKNEYYKIQLEEYRSKLFPALPLIDIKKTLDKMIKSGK